MELSAITPEVVAAMGAAMTASSISISVEKKVLAMAQQQGGDLAQLIASSGGVGSQVDTYA